MKVRENLRCQDFVNNMRKHNARTAIVRVKYLNRSNINHFSVLTSFSAQDWTLNSSSATVGKLSPRRLVI